MLSSMVWACLLAGTLSPAGPTVGLAPAASAEAGPATFVSAPRCASEPIPAPVLAGVPWPQQRYDLSVLSQISDGTGVTVAVVDSGVDATHPQLATAVRPGHDLLDRSGDGRLDCVGHGTAVASIIAAQPVAGSGLRGLAPAVRILPIRVSERVAGDEPADGDGSGDGGVAELAAGIMAAVDSRPKPAVINLSISTTHDDTALRAAVTAALEADIVVVAAAGNRHLQGDPRPYPASYAGVVGVGAIGPDGLRVPSSQVGSHVDIVAPGDGVTGATPRRGHQTYQGTSFAVPFVAATAALIRSRWPRLGQAEVARRLLATADPAAGSRPSAGYGYGVLNPVRAVTEIVPPAKGAAASPPALAGVAPPDPPHGPNRGPAPVAAGAAAVLILCAAAVAALAAAVPPGRRRRWRPGRIESGSARPQPGRPPA